MSNFLTYETYSLFRPARKFYLAYGSDGVFLLRRIGRLVFRFHGSFRQYFSIYRAISQWDGERNGS